jgi:hypothetical protein
MTNLNSKQGGSSMENFKTTVDAALNRLVTSEPRVPGVVAMATDRSRNIYEGAAGKRRLDRDASMTTATVFANGKRLIAAIGAERFEP